LRNDRVEPDYRRPSLNRYNGHAPSSWTLPDSLQSLDNASSSCRVRIVNEMSFCPVLQDRKERRYGQAVR